MSESQGSDSYITPPPQHLRSEQRWSPPNPNIERVDLGRDETFLVDTEAEGVADISAFNLPAESHGTKLDVVGVIQMKGADPKDPIRKMGIIRETRPAGGKSFHLVANKEPKPPGNETHTWISLPKDVSTTIGRQNTDGRHGHYDGFAIFGEELSDGISRNHFEVVLTDDGVEVKDISTNGTRVEAVRAKPAAKEAGELATGVVAKPELISHVPITSEEVKADLARQEAAKAEQYNAPIRQHIDELNQTLSGLMQEHNLSGKDVTELNAYHQAAFMKRRWQESGNGDLSIASSQNMGTAMNNMSPQARRLADRWHRINDQIDSLRDRMK